MAIGNAQWEVSKPAGTAPLQNLDDWQRDNNAALERLFKNSIQGCTLVYNSATTVDIAIGQVSISNGSLYRLRENTAVVTVTVAGGSADADSIYDLYAVADSAAASTFTGEAAKQGASPSGAYTRRVGSIATDGSSNIRHFYMIGPTNDRTIYYTGDIALVDLSPPTGSFVNADITAYVPTSSSWGYIRIHAGNSSSDSGISFRADGESLNFRDYKLENSFNMAVMDLNYIPLVSGIFEWNVAGTGLSATTVKLWMQGYVDEV